MNVNKCIKCNVDQCANHADCGDYCALDQIVVGTHECDPKVTQCTDCQSFVKK